MLELLATVCLCHPDEHGIVAHPHEVSVRRLDSLQFFADNIVGFIDQLFHSRPSYDIQNVGVSVRRCENWTGPWLALSGAAPAYSG
jgi:hypothetical protein